ncbi:unnamed protein product, partial [Coregonus sp. 'balchen']
MQEHVSVTNDDPDKTGNRGLHCIENLLLPGLPDDCYPHAKQRTNVKLINLVLSTKGEVDTVDYGNTGLYYACQRKSHSLIPLLLEKNADVSIKNKYEAVFA